MCKYKRPGLPLRVLCEGGTIKVEELADAALGAFNSLSIFSAGRLINRAEVSARSVSNLNRSSNSVRMASIDSCICQPFGSPV